MERDWQCFRAFDSISEVEDRLAVFDCIDLIYDISEPPKSFLPTWDQWIHNGGSTAYLIVEGIVGYTNGSDKRRDT